MRAGIQFLSAALAFLVWAAIAGPSLAQQVTAVPRIVDADTIEVGVVKVRLNGIDTPETDQRCLHSHGQVWSCGVEATSKLQAYSRNQPWQCQLSGTRSLWPLSWHLFHRRRRRRPLACTQRLGSRF